SGVKSSNIREIHRITKATSFHASARKNIASHMKYLHPSMKEQLDKISIDEHEVRSLRKTLDEIFV
ncbi:MAG: hypothetical protein RL640_757, partial [Bacteroidota bacterium]